MKNLFVLLFLSFTFLHGCKKESDPMLPVISLQSGSEYTPDGAVVKTGGMLRFGISVDGDPVPAEAYDQCHNDSLLIVAYDDVWGKRKFKWADPGDIIPFLTAKGKKGLLKVLSADHAATGTITFSLKIQQ
jgi:hypothetical protein